MSRAQPQPGLKTRTRTLRLLLHVMRSKDVDVLPFLRSFGQPETAIHDEETVVPLATLHEMFERAEVLLGDPFLGLHMALDYQRGTFGVMEYTFRFAPTLREACLRLFRYVRLTNDVVKMTFEETNGRGRVRHSVPGHSLCLGRHLNEFIITALVLQMRQITGKTIVPATAWFAHPAPPDAAPLVDILGTKEITFGLETNGVSFAEETLSIPLPSADPTLLAIMERVADERLEAIPPTESFSPRVRHAIRERMTGVVPTLPAVAAAFHMSARTFQRRLGEEDTSFARLIDAVREDMAKIYVAEQKLSLGEIAYLLGYAELSAFLRAFKRWTGVTPPHYRKGST